MTATTTPTLAEAMAERWRTAPKASQSEWHDDRLAVLDALEQALVGDYWAYDDPPDEDTEQPVAPGWLQELKTTIIEAGTDAFEAHVVPAVIAAISAYLPSAPAHLRTFPKSEQLRADLAALEGPRR